MAPIPSTEERKKKVQEVLEELKKDTEGRTGDPATDEHYKLTLWKKHRINAHLVPAYGTAAMWTDQQQLLSADLRNMERALDHEELNVTPAFVVAICTSEQSLKPALEIGNENEFNINKEEMKRAFRKKDERDDFIASVLGDRDKDGNTKNYTKGDALNAIKDLRACNNRNKHYHWLHIEEMLGIKHGEDEPHQSAGGAESGDESGKEAGDEPSKGLGIPFLRRVRTYASDVARSQQRQPFLKPKGQQRGDRNSHALSDSYSHAPRRRRPYLRVLSGLVILGAGFAYFTDTGRNAYNGLERTARVTSTLSRCVVDYWRTLDQREKLEPADYDALLKACHKRCAERTLVAMERNGSIFIKLGQHLCSLNYLLPSEWCNTFIPLQDQCPVTPYSEIRALIEHDTGQPISEVFVEFEEEPLGAASLAQVHRAVDKQSGEKVAVKIQHPVLDHWAPLDLALTASTFALIKWVFPNYDLTWLSDEMQVSLPQELDFDREGQNAMVAREYFSKLPSFPLVIPNVLWTRRRILVMEYVTGARPDDLQFLDSHHISRDEVAATLARIFNTMIFGKDAPLHCDPHGGNIAIRTAAHRRGAHNFDIIMYDHGLYRTIPQSLQRDYAHLWLAVLDADEDRMRKYAKATAQISDEDFPLFASAITGRDYRAITSKEGGVSASARTKEEEQAISDALGEGMLEQLIGLLGKVPRVILLILKTNDLTRSLDYNLQTTQGPARSFLILARYAAQAVWEEQLDALREHGTMLRPRNAGRLAIEWVKFTQIRLKLRVYEMYLYVRGKLGMRYEILGPSV
ncbi:MAG: hypothetical protein Q9162_005536 [Coniocarpon cinnabarinum]